MVLVTYLGQHACHRNIDDMWPELGRPSREEVPVEESDYFRGVEDLHYIALYELGIFLMYVELKTYAQKRLLHNFTSHLHHLNMSRRWLDIPEAYFKQVTRVLEETYNRIPADEGNLRLEVTAVCIENRVAINDFGEVCRLSEVWDSIEHEPFAWQLGLRLKLEGEERKTQELHDRILREARYQRP